MVILKYKKILLKFTIITVIGRRLLLEPAAHLNIHKLVEMMSLRELSLRCRDTVHDVQRIWSKSKLQKNLSHVFLLKATSSCTHFEKYDQDQDLMQFNSVAVLRSTWLSVYLVFRHSNTVVFKQDIVK